MRTKSLPPQYLALEKVAESFEEDIIGHLGVDDIVKAQWAGDLKWYDATVDEVHDDHYVTVTWLDGFTTCRKVKASQVLKGEITGKWYYGGAQPYEIHEEKNKLFFEEVDQRGQLHVEGDWLFATLKKPDDEIHGCIRLKYHSGKITSNFMRPGGSWGVDIEALKAIGPTCYHGHPLKYMPMPLNTCDIGGVGCKELGTSFRCSADCDFDACDVCCPKVGAPTIMSERDNLIYLNMDEPSDPSTTASRTDQQIPTLYGKANSLASLLSDKRASHRLAERSDAIDNLREQLESSTSGIQPIEELCLTAMERLRGARNPKSKKVFDAEEVLAVIKEFDLVKSSGEAERLVSLKSFLIILIVFFVCLVATVFGFMFAAISISKDFQPEPTGTLKTVDDLVVGTSSVLTTLPLTSLPGLSKTELRSLSTIDITSATKECHHFVDIVDVEKCKQTQSYQWTSYKVASVLQSATKTISVRTVDGHSIVVERNGGLYVRSPWAGGRRLYVGAPQVRGTLNFIVHSQAATAANAAAVEALSQASSKHQLLLDYSPGDTVTMIPEIDAPKHGWGLAKVGSCGKVVALSGEDLYINFAELKQFKAWKHDVKPCVQACKYNCKRCAVSAPGATNFTCETCMNDRYLYLGDCVEHCPYPLIEFGKEVSGKECLTTAVIAERRKATTPRPVFGGTSGGFGFILTTPAPTTLPGSNKNAVSLPGSAASMTVLIGELTLTVPASTITGNQPGTNNPITGASIFLDDTLVQDAVRRSIASTLLTYPHDVYVTVTAVDATTVKVIPTVALSPNKPPTPDDSQSAWKGASKAALTAVIQSRIRSVRGSSHTVTVKDKGELKPSEAGMPCELTTYEDIGGVAQCLKMVKTYQAGGVDPAKIEFKDLKGREESKPTQYKVRGSCRRVRFTDNDFLSSHMDVSGKELEKCTPLPQDLKQDVKAITLWANPSVTDCVLTTFRSAPGQPCKYFVNEYRGFETDALYEFKTDEEKKVTHYRLAGDCVKVEFLENAWSSRVFAKNEVVRGDKLVRALTDPCSVFQGSVKADIYGVKFWSQDLIGTR